MTPPHAAEARAAGCRTVEPAVLPKVDRPLLQWQAMEGVRRQPAHGLLTAAAVGVRGAREVVEQAAVTLPARVLNSNRVSSMRLLLARRPVARIGPVTVLTRREDVRAALADDRTFQAPFAHGLAGGFVLTLTGRDLERGRAALQQALRPSDEPALGRLAGQLAEDLVSRRLPRLGAGELAVGADLVHPLLDTVVREYVGLRQPDRATLLAWSRLVFQGIFLNLTHLPTVRQRGEVAVHQLAAAVRAELASRATTSPHGEDPSGDEPPDLIGRLLAQRERDADFPFDEQQLVDNVVGLAIGWLWHGATSALLAVDGVLDRPEALALAHRAARAEPEPDLGTLRHVCWEALRFRPVQVGLPRHCPAGATVAPGTARETRIPAGGQVLIGTHASMWDPTEVPDPASFDPTRADGQYLVFGHGPHRCLGEGVMRQQLPALLAPLLALDGLHRAPGPRGRLSWDGAAPDDLHVRFSRP